MADPSASTGKIIVPNLVTDPVWSLDPWPVTIQLGRRELEIPALPARDWLAVLMVADFVPEAVLPGLLADPAEGDEEIGDALLAGEVDPEELDQAVLDVITAVSGRPWWVAMRLIGTARGAWQTIGAEMIMKVDAARISLSAWLDVALLLMMRNIDEQQATMFALQLEMPPPNVDVEEVEPEMAASSFMAMGDG